jgi:DNA replication protein DnaC
MSAAQIQTLVRGEWVAQAENLILAEPIGTGKTHLPIALGWKPRSRSSASCLRARPISAACQNGPSH